MLLRKVNYFTFLQYLIQIYWIYNSTFSMGKVISTIQLCSAPNSTCSIRFQCSRPQYGCRSLGLTALLLPLGLSNYQDQTDQDPAPGSLEIAEAPSDPIILWVLSCLSLKRSSNPWLANSLSLLRNCSCAFGSREAFLIHQWRPNLGFELN